MMTPFDKRNLREINDFFSYLPLYFEFTIGRNGACHFIRNFSASAHPQHASIAGVVPHAALTNPSLSATFFDTILSFSIRARN